MATDRNHSNFRISGNVPEKGKTDFLLAAVPLAFRHHLSALISKVTTAGNRPVGSIQ
jgi:hypothetical protein